MPLQFRLHFTEGVEEGIEVLRIEHDGRFPASARFLGDLEELPITRFLEVDVERALFGVDRDRVQLLAVLARAFTAVPGSERGSGGIGGRRRTREV